MATQAVNQSPGDCGCPPVVCHCGDCDIPEDTILTLTWDAPRFPGFGGSATLTPNGACGWISPCEPFNYYNFCGVVGSAYTQFECGGAALTAFCGLAPGCVGFPFLMLNPVLVDHTCSPIHFHYALGEFEFFVDG